MRLSETIIYFNVDGVLLSYLMVDIPGILEENWSIFLFSDTDCTKVVTCIGPVTDEEFTFLRDLKNYTGSMKCNNSFYEISRCNFIRQVKHCVEPPCVAVISKIKPRVYSWYMRFNLDMYISKKIPSIKFD